MQDSRLSPLRPRPFRPVLLALAVLGAAAAAEASVVLTFDQFTTDASASNYGSRVTASGTDFLDLGGRNFTAFTSDPLGTPGIVATWSSGMRFDGVVSTPGNQYGAPGDKLLRVAYSNASNGTTAENGFQGVTFRADPGVAFSLLSLRVATDSVFSTSIHSLRIQTSTNGVDWTTQYQNFSFGAVANATWTLDSITTLDSLGRSVAIDVPAGGLLRIETNRRWNLVMDDIQIVQVPEPSSAVALALAAALGGVLVARRRRSRA